MSFPAGDGCPCARPTLAAGVVPTTSNTGPCLVPTPMQTYSSDLTINQAFINSRGSSVVHSIHVNGSIKIEVSNVTVCNFRAGSVKIGGSSTKTVNGVSVSGFHPVTGILMQDGIFESTTAGVLVNFAPNTAGMVRRVQGIGGSSDGIRVGITAAGGTQTVMQSYFDQIGAYRDAAAHSDLVQTYPVPGNAAPINGDPATNPEGLNGTPIVSGDASYHSSLIQQNYFRSATVSTSVEPTGIAVNATWMAMVHGAQFRNNYVARVYQGFWIEPERAAAADPIYVTGNVFDEINGFFDLDRPNDYGVGLFQTGNVDTTGAPVNAYQQ